VAALVQQYNLPELLARIIVGRGIVPEEAHGWLQPRIRTSMPDPRLLKDIDKAVARILRAIEAQEKVAIFGDYDVDGATSTALLVRYLKQFALEPIVYIPDRVKEGYGPSLTAFESLESQGVSLIITVDCGTVAFDAIDTIAERNCDVIVVDHHIAQPQLPNAVAVVNPNRLDDDSACGNLAAVGVTWMLLTAINSALRDVTKKPLPDLLQFLDLVALGTICDVVTLKGLNRALVAQGMRVMNEQRNIGLRALCTISRLDEAPNPYHAGFLLGPRINAGGRVGAAGLGSELLCSDDPLFCQQAAETLDRYNGERQAIEQMVREEAERMAECQSNLPAICVANPGWHEGVIGIVAGRLKELYDRPALVMSINGDTAKGSARSVPGVDIGAAVTAARQMGILTAGGGHAMAAGFSLPVQAIPAFETFLHQRLEGAVSDYQSGRQILYDAEVHVGALTLDTFALMAQGEPYGMGNPAPRLALRQVDIRYCERMKDAHLRLTLSQGSATARAVAFQAVGQPLGEVLEQRKPVHLVGQLKRNRWQGVDSAQFIISEAALA